MTLNGNEKILICDFRRIGDGIMTLPMFQAIKMRYPNTKLTFLCENIAEGIADNNPYIDEVFYFDKNSILDNLKLLLKLRSQKFDVAIDSLGMPKTAFFAWASSAKKVIGIHHKRAFFYTDLYQDEFDHTYSAHHKLNVLKLIDAFPKESAPLPFMNILEQEQKDLLRSLQSLYIEKKEFFTSSPGSKLEETLWSPQNWAKAYDWMIERYNLPIILQYAPSEKSFAESILEFVEHKEKVIFGVEFKTIREASVLLSLSKFHFAQNNGSKHLANCVKTPCFTIWGYDSTSENWQIPTTEIIDNILWAREYQNKTVEYKTTTEPITLDLVKENIEKILDGKN